MGDGDLRVPRLAEDWQARGRSLSPEEGFLLSRIDGRTTWGVLRQIGGLPPEQVDRCLERWLDGGLVEIAPRPGAGSARAPRGETEPGVDLSPELQREIAAMEAALERPYHELLGVARDADPKAIKRAYFTLSKRFHPDRYFRRQIGSFRGRLERIFKKLAEAYELLSDPLTRAEVERSFEARPAAEAPRPAPAPRPGRREHLERLRRRFRLPDSVRAERQRKARDFHEAARHSFAEGRWLEAAASARLAIAFDPFESRYKATFSEVQIRLYEFRAAELLRQPQAGDAASRQETLRLYEEVLHYRPGDAAVQHQGARLAAELGELDKAREYAQAACEIAPEVAAHHLTLAQALRRAGALAEARRALGAAEKLAPEDRDVREERRALQRAGRNR